MSTGSSIVTNTLVPLLLEKPTTKGDGLPETMSITSMLSVRSRTEKNDIRLPIKFSVPRKVFPISLTIISRVSGDREPSLTIFQSNRSPKLTKCIQTLIKGTKIHGKSCVYISLLPWMKKQFVLLTSRRRTENTTKQSSKGFS